MTSPVTACDRNEVPALGRDEVIRRLERAGATLLALRVRGYSTEVAMRRHEVVREAVESYGWQDETIRPAVPNARAVAAMDEAFGWLAFIPDSDFVARRVVSARSLVDPVTDRYLFSWYRLGRALRMHTNTVQARHERGVEIICRRLTGVSGLA